MRVFDRVPEASPDALFPYGDIDRNSEAEEWLATLDEDDWDDFMEYFDAFEAYEAFEHTPSLLTTINRTLAEQICDRWDGSNEGGYARLGYRISRAFIAETEMLPDPDAELRLALIRMKHETTAGSFASSAWHGMMQSHPQIFAYFEAIYNYAVQEADIDIAGNAKPFIAGMCLPYMMSVSARLANDAKESEFTSMVNLSEEKHELQKVEFGSLFSTETPLDLRKRYTVTGPGKIAKIVSD